MTKTMWVVWVVRVALAVRAGVRATKRIIVTMAKPKNLQRMRVGVSNE